MNAMFSLLILLIPGTKIFGQDEAAMMLAQVSRYYENKSIEAGVIYRVFESEAHQSPMEEVKGYYRCNGKSYYLKIGQIETLVNQNYMIVVDHPGKTITISHPGTAASNIGNKPFDIRVLNGIYKSLNLKKSGVTVRIEMNLHDESPLEFRRIVYEVNPENSKLVKLILYYRYSAETYGITSPSAPRVEITYLNQKVGNSLANDLFSEQQFIHKISNKLSPIPKLAGYKLINTIER